MRFGSCRAWLVAVALFASAPFSLSAQDRDDWGRHADVSHRAQYIHANISGGSGNGKCTFEVVVTGVADVEIRGDEGRLISIDGARLQPASAVQYQQLSFFRHRWSRKSES